MVHCAAPRPAVPPGSGRLARLLAICLPLLLGACASTRVIDSEVRSFASSVAPQSQASFRFDRLPSQQSTDPQEQSVQEQLEAMATSALAGIGLRPEALQPTYLVQVNASVEMVARTPLLPRPGLGGMWGFRQQPPFGVGMPFLPHLPYLMEPPWSRYGVHILLRDAASQQVVFESSAQHVGPWSDTANVMPAVLRAALRSYPSADPKGHTLRVEIGPRGLVDLP